ncbi:hypothetical protein [Pajaroellobacter abortibovis]|uniref:Uncharacterized protein n=1 Tax=Pajaroellobacter abortibovis TaxID=1882918 RepID=A0A1L6MYB1_9BACT|nr:hypothetical protein [Pajaroellobacter abortibovis]APS00534.1 hypothetical protein BCY86_07485 [Pajaroellobacter abortibovis]
MTNPKGIYRIGILRGHGTPDHILVVEGQVVEPTSIGRKAMWSIQASGLLDIHAFLYFDGKTLFICSATTQFPAKLNHHPIPTEWTPIPYPCQFQCGEATFSFEEAPDSALSALDTSIPLDNSILEEEEIPLSLIPEMEAEEEELEEIELEAAVPSVSVLPPVISSLSAASAKASTATYSLTAVESQAHMLSLSTKTDPATGPLTDGPLPANTNASKQLTRLQVLLFAAIFISLVGVGFLWTQPKKAEQVYTLVPNPSSLASASPSTNTSVSPPVASNATTLPTIEVKEPSESSSYNSSKIKPIPSVPSRSHPLPNAANPASTLYPKNLERAAADAFMQGDQQAAMKLYDRLAAENPTRPVFQQASRILHRRLEAPSFR